MGMCLVDSLMGFDDFGLILLVNSWAFGI
jgi:hypothetical protein